MDGLKFKGKALINGAVLEWARRESGFSLQELAGRMKIWKGETPERAAGASAEDTLRRAARHPGKSGRAL